MKEVLNGDPIVFKLQEPLSAWCYPSEASDLCESLVLHEF
jgi:hypothetical protein